ncbi:MAG: CHRD domain-containing protein [Planctomycetes bacterium]|nr:CHRD domain-containing protein [Planctomycetota bacterium]
MRFAASSLLAAVLSAPLAAQTLFYADIDGTQETPPNTSTAGGWARVTLNAGNTLTYDVRTWGLSATSAHIHDGAAGVGGPIVVALAGGPTVWSGTSAALTVAQVADLRSEGLYVNIHTAGFPLGEVRGQLVTRPNRFGAFLVNDQEVPPTASTATGVGAFSIDSALDLTYSLSWTAANGTAAHLHAGAVGALGGIAFSLLGGPMTWAGMTGPVGESDYTLFQTMGLYANIHTAALPGGAIRGQVIPNGIKYGDTALMPVDLDVSGVPASGGTISIAIAGGNPGGLAQLMVALGPGAGLVKGVPFLLDPGALIITSVLLPLDGAGAITLPFVLPDVGATFDIYMQVFATTGGPLKASNGLRLPLVDLPF